MASDDYQEKAREIFKRFSQRIAELDTQNAELEKKLTDQHNKDAEILFKQKQAELSQLFLLDNLSIFQTAQLLAWSNEIAHYQLNGNFHEIAKILTSHFEKVKFTLPVVEEAVSSGALECQIHRNTTADLSIDRNNSLIAKSAMRKWLITKPGYFSSGFFPEINSAEEWEPIRQRMLSEQETYGTARLVTLEKATEEGRLDKYHLLRVAEQGHESLELLVYVDHKYISGGVEVSDMSAEPGYYLAIPSYYAPRLIEKGDAYVESFFLPKAYLPPCAGLVVLQQIIVQSRDHTIGTREPYHIKLDQDKIWVVRQQVEKFFKRTLEEHVLAQPYSLEPDTSPRPENDGIPIEMPQSTSDDYKRNEAPADMLIKGKESICKNYGCKLSSWNGVVRMAKKHDFEILHPDGENNPPALWLSQIIRLKALKHLKAPTTKK